jgi:hypothetical protein
MSSVGHRLWSIVYRLICHRPRLFTSGVRCFIIQQAGSLEKSVCVAVVNGCLQRDPTEIGADVFLGVVGVEVAASLAEAVDFLAGIVLLDPQGDDLGCNTWD